MAENIEPDFDLMEACWNDHEKQGHALAVMLTALFTRPGAEGKPDYDKAKEQGCNLVADVLASHIAMLYLAKKSRDVLEGGEKDPLQVFAVIAQSLEVHGKLKDVMPGFFAQQIERARRDKGPDEGLPPSRLN